MGRIYLVRHGQASLLGDDYDALSETGYEQSRIVGKWLASRQIPFHHMVMGSLKRHAQTAEACLPFLSGRLEEVVIDADLNEYHHEDMVGVHTSEYSDRSALQARLHASDNPRREFQKVFSAAFARWVGGEHDEDYRISWSDFRARNMAALERIAARCGSGENALVFTSGGPIAAITQHLLGVPDARVEALHFPLFNAGITQLMCQPGRIGISYLNAVGHLEAMGPESAKLLTYR